MTRAARRRERGLVRSCCIGFILLLAFVGAAAYFADRALAAPSLGAPPGGSDDGETQTQIALTLASGLVTQLMASPHGAVKLSEHDLTVLARAHNPHPDRYTDIAVRVRGGRLVISANDQVGPFTVTPVLHASPVLTGSTDKSIKLQVDELDVGQLALPGFLRDHFVGDLPSVVSLPALFQAAPHLLDLSSYIECVAVITDGVAIGVHRPGVVPSASTCNAPPS